MQVGTVFPQTEIGADPDGVREYAQAVQELGYRHLLAGKTKGLQGIAEQLSEAGVSVFAADMKGDLSGLSKPGGSGRHRRRPLKGARRDL